MLYQADYVWRLDNTLDTRIEFDATTQQTATVEFQYDNRHRLTRETRSVNSTQVYDIEYEYDQLANRPIQGSAPSSNCFGEMRCAMWNAI